MGFMGVYDFKRIEKKWQERWEKEGVYRAEDFSKKPKFYALIEFPYPSGEGLHVGHPRSYGALDVVARKKRMEGHNVLYPIGWDAFGLPAENYAIKMKRKPQEVTKENIETFRRQLKSLGLSFDWSREVNTTDPAYYKWTQWIFLQFFEKGLAYKKKMAVNWCPSCKIVLANEEVVDGKCERCEAETTRKMQEQWMLKITEYAERLLKDLDAVDYSPRIRKQQEDWIGRSEGAEFMFAVKDLKEKIAVFTTRPDTIFGATYMVVAPEHESVGALRDSVENWEEVEAYAREAGKKSDLDRTDLAKKKTGVELKGVQAINPANGEEIPVWVADYVLVSYGTGAIMAVPAHDERDKEFAEQFGLPLGNGKLVDGKKIVQKAGGKWAVNYKLRDWVFSRQHYWGEPIPLIDCEKCGWVPVPEKDLPVELPEVEHYEPTDTGESPLALIQEWVNVKCPTCKGEARRETDTMPNWAGSSWYFLRYCDSQNDKALADKKKLKYWMPVDLYNGGMEHTTLHLLYSRFWHKFLFDIGAAPTPEPYARRRSHGIVLAEDGQKMSKSRGNVINPDEMVSAVGADAFRLYELFMGPFSQMIPWSTAGLRGMKRFLDKAWKLEPRKDSGGITHRTVKQVTEDIDAMKFNTALARLMEYVNSGEYDYTILLTLLAPFAPHITEELWERAGNNKSIHLEKWPGYNPKLVEDDTFALVVQVNGKTRATVSATRGISEKKAKELALGEERVQKFLEGSAVKKVVFVKDRLINFVI
jgi:leucyl-tRNA synthetase